MATLFYVAAAVAVASALMVVTRRHPVHALLYLIVSLLAVAAAFFALGSPFAAALQVIVYAGAIMVLFVFVMMMLNLGAAAAEQERRWLKGRMWIGPSALSLVLLVQLVVVLSRGEAAAAGLEEIDPKQVGTTLFGPYVLAVQLAGMLLLGGLVGAFHLGREDRRGEAVASRAAAGEERDRREAS